MTLFTVSSYVHRIGANADGCQAKLRDSNPENALLEVVPSNCLLEKELI